MRLVADERPHVGVDTRRAEQRRQPGLHPPGDGLEVQRSTRSRPWSTSTIGSLPPTAPAATGHRLRGDRGRVHQPRPDARPGPAGRAARRRPGPLADPARRQRPGGRDRGQRRGGERQGRGGRREARAVTRVQDLMPRRKPAYRRVTPLASRRETQRRGALAILALVIVVGGLGFAVYAFGGSTPQQAISSVNAGQKALDQARADLAKVTGSGDRPRDGRPGPGSQAPDRRPRPAPDRRRRPGSAPLSSRPS